MQALGITAVSKCPGFYWGCHFRFEQLIMELSDMVFAIGIVGGCKADIDEV